jgi:hypothetical protein
MHRSVHITPANRCRDNDRHEKNQKRLLPERQLQVSCHDTADLFNKSLNGVILLRSGGFHASTQAQVRKSSSLDFISRIAVIAADQRTAGSDCR